MHSGVPHGRRSVSASSSSRKFLAYLGLQEVIQHHPEWDHMGSWADDLTVVALYDMVALTSLALFVALAVAKPLDTRAACDTYTVANVPGGFRSRQFIDFSTAKAGQNARDVLGSQGLYISDWDIPDPQFISHTFTPNNVALTNGALSLKVSKYSGSGNIISAEIFTEENVKYASVRTVLKSSTTKGVCEGMFFYKDGQGEIDLEILTSTTLQSSAKVPKGFWTTNHDLANHRNVSSVHEFSFNPSAGFHEYRIDWSPSATSYYVDGVNQGQLTQLVPQITGSWLWNAWSNGDNGWSAGPPTSDSFTYIRSIEIIKDYTTTVSGNVCKA
ncbi:hypothetical protein NMY22_g16000 [Coprinellus aureogranulatus]|nr:hypothetical protein NMY22_g16000 [Coprinellus aureogranulatus]